MPALLAAQSAAVFGHIFIYILIAHGGFGIADALLVKGLVQAKVGHHGRYHRVGDQLAALFHIAAVDIQNMVARDHIALFVHAQAAVSIAVIGKADVQPFFHHKLLQPLNMGRACVVVDVQAVGLIVDHIGVGAQGIKHALGNVPAAAVGAVQAHLHAPEGVNAQADQIAHIAVAARHIVHRAAHMLTAGKGQLGPIAAKQVQLAVQIILNERQGLLGHFFACAVDQLNAVVVIGVVAGRDHNTAVKIVHTGNVGHAGCGGHVQQIGICARGRQTGHQTVLKHIAGTAGVLADHNAGGLGVALLLAQGAVIPAQKTAHLIAVVSGQVHTGFAAKAVGSKIFPHVILLMIPRRAKAHGPAAAKGCILLFVSECSPRFCAAFRCISPPPQPGACMALF